MRLDPWVFKLTSLGRARWQAENETGDTIFTITALTRRAAKERVTDHVPWATVAA